MLIGHHLRYVVLELASLRIRVLASDADPGRLSSHLVLDHLYLALAYISLSPFGAS
jgi:hypothetical protein